VPPAPCNRPGGWPNLQRRSDSGQRYDAPSGLVVNGEEIRNQLELLEMQTVELASGLIAAIAEIRVRLVLLEAVVDLPAVTDARDRDR
jgi:hypothetical protein